MSTAPASIISVAKAWKDGGGVPLGIVGDLDHTYGYHLGRDRIFGPKGQGWHDYSVQTKRDRAGLTNYASGIDLGRIDDSLGKLQAFSEWLLEECRHAAPDTLDIRELIYSPDAVVVLRWDRERGVTSPPRPGEADDGHRTHDHISWYRDARLHDLAAVFRRYFAGGTAMGPKIQNGTAADEGTATVAGSGKSTMRTADGSLNSIPAGTAFDTFLSITVLDGAWAGQAGWLVQRAGVLEIVKAADATHVPKVEPAQVKRTIVVSGGEPLAVTVSDPEPIP